MCTNICEDRKRDPGVGVEWISLSSQSTWNSCFMKFDFKFTTSIFLIWKSKRNIWLYSSYILLLLWPNPLIWATGYIGYTEMCNVTTASLSENHYFRCWSPSFFLLYSGTAVYLCILNCMSTCPVPVPYYNKEKNIELSGHSQLNFL